MESKKLEKPCENATFQALQGVMKPDGDTGSVLPTMKPLDMVKKETGRTPQEHIQEKVIEMAKERMIGTEDTVSQIAYSLGFQYPQHFCRLFKKRVGCTPNEYRIQNNL